MENSLNFEAKNKHVEEVLFSHMYKFRIPRYQRPYAWENDQISEFWNDLVTSSDPYFIGSLILNHEPYKETGYLDIIDGQQRLLTITIFMAVLRDIAKTIDPAKSNLFHTQDIAILDRSGNESYRILPGDSTRAYFEENIQNKNNEIFLSAPVTKEEIRIKKNYTYLHEKVTDELKKFDNNDSKLSSLAGLRTKISNLIVIDIKIENEEEAYEIFETTNARGVDLSISDLLKNLIFKKIPVKKDRDLAKEIWKDITSNIESAETELKKFIRYFWVSKYSFIGEKNLFREIKKEITDWAGLLDDLWDSSEWYNKLREGSEDDFQELKNGSKIYKSIFSIRLMNVSQCYVLLLSILRNFNKLGTDPTRIFQLIEKFTFKYSVVCKLPGNKVEKIYSKFALKIEKTLKETEEKKVPGKIQAVFSELEKELKDEAPSLDVFNEYFSDISYRNSEQSRKLVKYTLNEIDNHYRKTAEEKIDFNNVNIEHILPQNPHKDWNLTKKEIKSYVNQLGNLTLLSKKLNSKVQNKIIKDKIPFLDKSTLPITKQLVKDLTDLSYTWNEVEIANRQENLSKLAYSTIWNLK